MRTGARAYRPARAAETLDARGRDADAALHMATAVAALQWRGERLDVLDQRVLPQRVEHVGCASAADVADAIRAMVVRGAPAIGCAAAYGVALEAQRLARAGTRRAPFLAGLEAGIERLAGSRPTAVNLFWALARMRAVVAANAAAGASPEAIAAAVVAAAVALHADDERTNRAIGAHGAALLADGARVLTHCNAGALATGGYGTALGVVRAAVEAGKRVRVIAGETRPFLQGARLTAWELLQDGIAVTLVTDSMVGSLLGRGEIDAVVVGADRVAANGDVVNKIGTYPIAVLAQRHHVPFWVACPLSTVDRTVPDGASVPIEERPADEVLGFGGNAWAPAGVAVRNPAFDVTPAELVGGLVTERGVVRAPDRAKLEALFAVP
jgi:methylthioribose-1-phosphate isomerase